MHLLVRGGLAEPQRQVAASAATLVQQLRMRLGALKTWALMAIGVVFCILKLFLRKYAAHTGPHGLRQPAVALHIAACPSEGLLLLLPARCSCTWLLRTAWTAC